LVDISQQELALAKTKISEYNAGDNVESVVPANILDLSQFPNSKFTATIALGGVLSHFIDERDRKKSIAELSRVTKEDGFIFLSVMNRFGQMSNYLSDSPKTINLINQFLKDGNHRRPTTGESTGTHFFTPQELIYLVKSSYLTIEEIASIQNIANPLRREINSLTPELFQQWLKIITQLSQEPSLLGISNHLLAVVRNTKINT
jgi:ubiquinone/menaquinone biosynthesis C-methylase UbiE